MLLLALGLLLVAGCCKKPNDSKPKSKWVILNEGREIHDRQIFFVDSLNGWAINDGGGETNAYYRTRDGGKTWILEGIPRPPYHGWGFFDLAFADTLNGWMVGVPGLIYHTDDGGRSWTIDNRFSDPGHPSDTYIKEVFFPDSLHGWIEMDAWQAWRIARTIDGGRSWQVVSESGRYLLQAIDADVAFAEGGEGHLFRTLDGGTTWQEIYGAEPQSWGGIFDCCFISPDEGWMALTWNDEYTMISYLIHTTNGGQSWDTLSTASDLAFGDIHILPDREGLIFAHGRLWHTMDAMTWQEDPLPDVGDRPIGNLFVLPSGEAWLTAGGLVLRRQD